MVQKCIVYKKIRKCRRNLFFAKLEVLKWRHTHSQSSVFVHHRKWNFTFLVHQNTGKENRHWIFCLLFLSVHCGDFIEQIKKKSVIYTLKEKGTPKSLPVLSSPISNWNLATLRCKLVPGAMLLLWSCKVLIQRAAACRSVTITFEAPWPCHWQIRKMTATTPKC